MCALSTAFTAAMADHVEQIISHQHWKGLTECPEM